MMKIQYTVSIQTTHLTVVVCRWGCSIPGFLLHFHCRHLWSDPRKPQPRWYQWPRGRTFPVKPTCTFVYKNTFVIWSWDDLKINLPWSSNDHQIFWMHCSSSQFIELLTMRHERLHYVSKNIAVMSIEFFLKGAKFHWIQQIRAIWQITKA